MPVRPHALACLALGLVVAVAPGHADSAIVIRTKATVTLDAHGTGTDQLRPTLVYFAGGEWQRTKIIDVMRMSAAILGQCGIATTRAELVQIEAPQRYHYLDTPVSRELARTLHLPRPTVYFVSDTRNRPAFDAEAIGRGNSRTRPELTDTVWITHDARDPGIVLAHELAHVLMDSGEHSTAPGNLMRDQTTPENTRLTATQCARLRDTGATNGLLQPRNPAADRSYGK